MRYYNVDGVHKWISLRKGITANKDSIVNGRNDIHIFSEHNLKIQFSLLEHRSPAKGALTN